MFKITGPKLEFSLMNIIWTYLIPLVPPLVDLWRFWMPMISKRPHQLSLLLHRRRWVSSFDRFLCPRFWSHWCCGCIGSHVDYGTWRWWTVRSFGTKDLRKDTRPSGVGISIPCIPHMFLFPLFHVSVYRITYTFVYFFCRQEWAGLMLLCVF